MELFGEVSYRPALYCWLCQHKPSLETADIYDHDQNSADQTALVDMDVLDLPFCNYLGNARFHTHVNSVSKVILE